MRLIKESYLKQSHPLVNLIYKKMYIMKWSFLPFIYRLLPEV